MKKEFTATVYIIKDQKVLLVYHHKFQKWLPPGGHVEPNESPTEAAKREVLEETGLTIEFIRQENVWVDYKNATSFERPYLCLTEDIPAHKDMPPHQHLDFVYIAKPIAQVQEAEDDPCRWFGLDELDDLTIEVDIFTDTIVVIKHLLSQSIVTTHPIYVS